MTIPTFEGIVRNGRIELNEDVALPELAKVFVVIPPLENGRRILSPRLVNKADARFFEKRVVVDLDEEIGPAPQD